MTSGTAKVDQTAFSKKDDVTTILHEITVDLGFDVLNGLGVGFEPGDVNLNVEMANVYDFGQ